MVHRISKKTLHIGSRDKRQIWELNLENEYIFQNFGDGGHTVCLFVCLLRKCSYVYSASAFHVKEYEA